MASFPCRGFSGMGCARVCACGGDESGSTWVTECALGSHAARAAELKRAQASAPPSSTRFGRRLRNPCCPRLRPGGWTCLFSSRVGVGVVEHVAGTVRPPHTSSPFPLGALAVDCRFVVCV